MNEPELEARLCLLSMPGMGPARFRWLTESESPSAVVESLRRGQVPAVSRAAPTGLKRELIARWEHYARVTDGASLVRDHHERGITILGPEHQLWPFSNDPEPPVLLFARGDLGLLARGPKVGIVGTRRCTSVGRRVATRLGADLAAAGVGVVSGLALGIDGCSHRGALSVGGGGAFVIGVVATGLDIAYPASHAELWDQVADRGLLLSESPLGVKPQKWRFPARNRLLAGLSTVIVVVESHERGGALSTVDEAVRRSIEVLVVPGSVLSSASVGTNALLYDGAAPVRSGEDIATFLGLCHPPISPPSNTTTSLLEPRSAPSIEGDGLHPTRSQLELDILQEVASGGAHLDLLISATGQSLRRVAEALGKLDHDNLVRLDGSVVTLAEEWPRC